MLKGGGREWQCVGRVYEKSMPELSQVLDRNSFTDLVGNSVLSFVNHPPLPSPPLNSVRFVASQPVFSLFIHGRLGLGRLCSLDVGFGCGVCCYG